MGLGNQAWAIDDVSVWLQIANGNCVYFIATLQYLRLGDNNIHTIPSNALQPLHKLRHLDLRANNISSIAEDAFAGYGDSITFLNLQKNE